MIRFAVSAVVFVVSAGIGLVVASVVVDGFALSSSGLLSVVVVFAVLQSVLSPFLAKVAKRNAPVLLGGIGLFSTWVALFVASRLGDALTLSGGLGTWVAATVVVWLATALATLALPVMLVRARIQSRREPS